MARVTFFLSTLRRLASGQPRNCPHCGGEDTVLIRRKKILLELRRCRDCFLMYRYPKDESLTNLRFYQTDYRQGVTTEIPAPAELRHLLETGFSGTEMDISGKVRIVREQQERGRLLDYGCSWGYGVYQFEQAGYDAVGFEISQPRVAYGRKHLHVMILSNTAALADLPSASFDVIHASHVLEHLPALDHPLAIFRRLLKPSGSLVIFVPNAGGQLAHKLDVEWGPMISEKHCLALDATFFAHNLPRYELHPAFDSSPYHGPLVAYESAQQAQRALAGDELLVVARPTPSSGTGGTSEPEGERRT